MEYSLEKENKGDTTQQEIAYVFAHKEVDHDAIFALLHEYPDNFLHGLFEKDAERDYKDSLITVAKQGGAIIGCVMYNPITTEFTWLAVSPQLKIGKSEIAEKLFNSVFKTLPEGSSFYWYVNTEDSVYPGYPKLGSFFEPARRLYKAMGMKFTRKENKLGLGTHMYKVEGVFNKD